MNNPTYKIRLFSKVLLGIIPRGCYCHFKDTKKVCRYWSLRLWLPPEERGYCSFMGKSDWNINEECKTVEVTHYSQNPHRETHKTIESTHEFPISMLYDKLKECY